MLRKRIIGLIILVFFLGFAAPPAAALDDYDKNISFIGDFMVNDGRTEADQKAERNGEAGVVKSGAEVAVTIENGVMRARVRNGTFVSSTGKTTIIINGKEQVAPTKKTSNTKSVSPKKPLVKSKKKTSSTAAKSKTTASSLLPKAASKGDFAQVKALLAKGADPNITDSIKYRALMYAVMQDRSDIARALLAAGAKPDFSVPGGDTPLIKAGFYGYTEMAKLLLKYHANPNLGSKTSSPLIAAAWEGHIDTMRVLIAAGAKVNDNHSGITPLIWSIYGNADEAAIKELLKCGANINYVDPKGKTALDYAKEFNKTNLYELLEQYGAKSGSKTVPGGASPKVTAPVTNNQSSVTSNSANLSPQSDPASGTVFKYSGDSGEAPLKIVTRSSNSNYFVKLVNWDTHQAIMGVFITSGQTAEVKVPLGTYEIRYATGSTWYGDTQLFGKNTNCYVADHKFEFKRTSSGVTGYTIELYPQANGNLGTDSINLSSF